MIGCRDRIEALVEYIVVVQLACGFFEGRGHPIARAPCPPSIFQSTRKIRAAIFPAARRIPPAVRGSLSMLCFAVDPKGSCARKQLSGGANMLERRRSAVLFGTGAIVL